MASKRRILRPEDEISREAYREELLSYSDKDARRLGYPSAEVLLLEHRLTDIAGQWRRTKEKSLITEYRETLYAMILKGYDIDMLPIQDQLPAALMPELPPPSVRSAIMQAYEALLD